MRQVLEEAILQVEALKGQAEAYTQVPTHQKNLFEKQKEQEMLILEKQSLLAQQSTLGFDEEAFQIVPKTLEQQCERERELLEQVYEASNSLKNAQAMESYERTQVEAMQKNYSRFSSCIQECFREECLSEASLNILL